MHLTVETREKSVDGRLANKQTAVCLFPSFVYLYQINKQSGGFKIGNQSI